MIDVEKLLRADGDRWRRSFDSQPLGGAVTIEPQRRQRRIRAAAWPIAAALLLVGVAAAVTYLVPARSHRPEPALGSRLDAVTHVQLTTAAGRVSLTLRLHVNENTVRRGDVVHATLTIVNDTAKVVFLDHDCNFPVVRGQLVNATVPARHEVSGGVACSAQKTTIQPGGNTFALNIPSTYLTCASEPTAGLPPACGSNGSLPALPAGQYRTDLTVNGLPARIATPAVTVTLTP